MSVRAWYGLLGAPLAWAGQLVVGFWIAQTACDRGGVEVDGWTLAVTVVAAAAAVGAELCAISLFRATDGDAPAPEGRVHFLATIGLTIGPLFLAIILMSGLGVVALPECHQA